MVIGWCAGDSLQLESDTKEMNKLLLLVDASAREVEICVRLPLEEESDEQTDLSSDQVRGRRIRTEEEEEEEERADVRSSLRF